MSFNPIYCLFTCLLITACGENKISKPLEKTKAVEISCEEAAFRILNSSDKFQELKKGIENSNPEGAGVMLEGSPHPTRDEALDSMVDFEFRLFENHKDHIVTISRFTYSIQKNQLFEYDLINNTTIRIDFTDSTAAGILKNCR